MVRSRLIELGQQALAAAVTNVATGAPLVRCQLYASEFYRALKRELRTTSQLGAIERGTLVAVAHLCCRAITANNGHDVMLEEFKRAIDLLKVDIPTCDRLAKPRLKPILRVIEGGLSRAV